MGSRHTIIVGTYDGVQSNPCNRFHLVVTRAGDHQEDRPIGGAERRPSAGLPVTPSSWYGVTMNCQVCGAQIPPARVGSTASDCGHVLQSVPGLGGGTLMRRSINDDDDAHGRNNDGPL